MTCQFEYLADRLDAIPELAQAHHAAWASLAPSVSVPDRERRFAERALRGQVPTALIATVNNAVAGVRVPCRMRSGLPRASDAVAGKRTGSARVSWQRHRVSVIGPPGDRGCVARLSASVP